MRRNTDGNHWNVTRERRLTVLRTKHGKMVRGYGRAIHFQKKGRLCRGQLRNVGPHWTSEPPRRQHRGALLTWFRCFLPWGVPKWAPGAPGACGTSPPPPPSSIVKKAAPSGPHPRPRPAAPAARRGLRFVTVSPGSNWYLQMSNCLAETVAKLKAGQSTVFVH